MVDVMLPAVRDQLLKALRLALFDFTEVLSLDCWSNGISPLASYTIRMLIPVFLYG
ncbi:hypothetical protein Pmar_PMAR013217 [Perkinsus marinus ATCC 50983]|uniref:Uncharacterized protein n=1 Tax=Perkinsus marinus (strain ATCC 50983 / TXsc) TaxID=423536 RepID=C5LET0_PERM5|nr:hypothetical protein Pmar_PMAR013217 [Perkinsus marinus ATCC 50983]EER04696.1 hypothetical protein Pmar_PMAR013217 [Perkinsus marinus ATCC 50983]|eukprot:XP_002772880.1 hypothetical protein Pmar_PMAR013217 [Perkinsus marinus ATCC 50983]